MRDINPGYPGAPEQRSIRNIPLNGRRHPHPEHLEQEDPRPRRPRRRGRVWLLGLLVVLIVAGGAFLLSTLFAGATVTVRSRQVTVDAPKTVEARLSAPVGVLEYRTISATAEASIAVDANGTQQVSRQASGVISISNNYSAESQRLIANTRFEAPDGKIYRIRESVTVPGSSAGKAGVVSATVYADSPGASYNKPGSTALTIPGFKGDPKYDKIVAAAGGIQGGFVGSEPAVAAADLQKAKDALQKQLEQDARSKVLSSVPEGYGLLPGMITVGYSQINQTPNGSKVTIAQSAMAVGAIVAGSDLGTAIAKAQVQGYQGEAVALVPDELEVSASSTAEGVIAIAMQGTATLVWQFDPAAVRQALVGKPKGEFQQILKSFAPAIECKSETPCDARLRPFWAATFPTDPNKIKVVTQTGSN